MIKKNQYVRYTEVVQCNAAITKNTDHLWKDGSRITEKATNADKVNPGYIILISSLLIFDFLHVKCLCLIQYVPHGFYAHMPFRVTIGSVVMETVESFIFHSDSDVHKDRSQLKNDEIRVDYDL